MAGIQRQTVEEMVEELNKTREWRSFQDYDRGFMRQMQEEIEEHWKFMAWLKRTYPEALEGWIAVNKLKGE